MSETTKVIIGSKLKPIRFSYANVWEPKAADANSKPKYSVSIIISKDDTETIEKVKKAITLALEQFKAKNGGKAPANLKQPLRDGDEDRPDDEAYANSYFINANSHKQPGIVDQDLQEFLDEAEFYSGCHGRASVNFYPYFEPTKGIAAGLQNVQKTAEGERLSGGASAADDFADEDLG